MSNFLNQAVEGAIEKEAGQYIGNSFGGNNNNNQNQSQNQSQDQNQNQNQNQGGSSQGGQYDQYINKGVTMFEEKFMGVDGNNMTQAQQQRTEQISGYISKGVDYLQNRERGNGNNNNNNNNNF
jgi:hypothetical protein